MTRILFTLFIGIFWSCNDSGTQEILVYDGPVREAENVEHLYTENGKVKVKMLADQLLERQNGDQEFPKGLYLEFYDEFGKLESTLRA
ncbi:MAG TPA: hypothetical protein VKZ75_08230, partial [Cyclobacteriaceae bacterium]|nr:hypothetical protein [Cyclobacteriaceae bacterium]